MSKPTHNITFKGRSYSDANGESRHAYPIIGAAWPNDEGEITRIQLETIPVNWNGVLYLRKREEAVQ